MWRRRKRRFYDPKDGENITCVAKAHTPRIYLHIYSLTRLYSFKYIRVYTYLSSVYACVSYVYVFVCIKYFLLPLQSE